VQKDYGICGICIAPEGLELVKSGRVYGVVEQPILISAELAVQYLCGIITGKGLPKLGETVAEEGAIWSPSVVERNEWADEGLMLVLQNPLVPQEISPDDPRLWENQLKLGNMKILYVSSTLYIYFIGG
jgi:ribose transport system substrate-binding protein